MKKKSLVALVTGVFTLTAIAVTASMTLSNSNLLRVRADPQAGGSFTITAANFGSGGDVDFVAGGESFRANNVVVDGNKVTINGNLYTKTFSGATPDLGRRGNGYTRMVFTDLDVSKAVGVVYHLKDVKGSLTETGNALSADNDIASITTAARRRGLEIVQGNPSSFSFTSLTLYYDCTDVTPTVDIQEASLSVGVGEDGNLTTKNSDVFAGDTVSYAWISDDTDILTVAGNGANATVTGVAAGSANVTVTMTVNGKDYTDTLEVAVTAAAATVKEMKVLDTSKVEGAGIFCRFNPSSASTTAALLDTYTSSVTLEFANPATVNDINHYTLQEKGDSSYTAYVVCDSAVGLSDAFTVTVDFKDNANNIIYRATCHFDGGKLAPEIVLTASSFSVDEGDDLEITASKASYIEGTATFAFESLDTSVFTVTAINNVATVRGVAEGSANLKVTMTVGEDEYILNKTIAVTEAGVEHLITWYTTGEGNQRNHWDGAGVWMWVNYGALDYADFGSFAAQKNNMTASCDKTGIRVEVISDDIAASKVCRVYLVANAAESTSTITMTIPDAHGVTYTGSIEFSNGLPVAYNGVPINA